MFAKRKNFRRRIGDEEDEDESIPPAAGSTQIRAAAVKPEKPSGGAGSRVSLLSFADDDADVDVPVGKAVISSKAASKKKAQGHTLSSKKRDSTADGGHKGKEKSGKGVVMVGGDGDAVRNPFSGGLVMSSNVVPQAGEYTKEKLAELAKNTLRLAAPQPKRPPPPPSSSTLLPPLPVKPVAPTAPPSASREPVLRIKGSFLPAGTLPDDSDSAKPSSPARSGLGLGFATGGVGGASAVPGPARGVVIPDARAIAEAKAKRERMRQAAAAPDFIPVPGGAGVGPDIERREREEGQGSSEEDEDEVTGRIAMSAGVLGRDRKQKGGKKMTGMGVAKDEREEEEEQEEGKEEEDEEAKRWEEEQLSKGVGKGMAALHTGRKYGDLEGDAAGGALSHRGRSASEVFGGKPSAGVGAGGLSMITDGKAAMAFLRSSIERLKSEHLSSQQAVQAAEQQLAASADAVLALEAAMRAAEKRYTFCQGLRQYLAVLCDFLKDKAVLIEELQDSLQQLQEERAAAVTTRQRLDREDEARAAHAAATAAMQAMAAGGGTATAAEAASAAVRAVEEGEEGAGRVELDEFGRDMGLQKRLEAKKRRQARERRQQKAAARRAAAAAAAAEAEAGGAGGAAAGASGAAGASSRVEGSAAGAGRAARAGGAVEGESSSEESEGEREAYAAGKKEVLLAADAVFADAASEFASLAAVKERMEDWKQQQPAAYRDAYASLSMPQLFAPFVRRELLRWDPLFEGGSFDTMEWYSTLFDFGLPADGAPPDPSDPDSHLVPTLVERVALPLLRHGVVHAWPLLSPSGNRRVLLAVEEVLVYVEPSAEAAGQLLQAVEARMQEAVEAAEVPAWPPPVLAASPVAARFAAHSFGRAVRLLRNIASWHAILPRATLDRLALEGLLLGRLLPHLRLLLPVPHDAVQRSERVVAALTGHLAGGAASTAWPMDAAGKGAGGRGKDRPPLAQLSSFLQLIATALETRLRVDGQCAEVQSLARRLKAMLAALGQREEAREVGRAFGLKEAV